MYKIISFQHNQSLSKLDSRFNQNICTIICENTIVSCARSIYFLLIKEPLFALKTPLALWSTENNLNTKVKVVMGSTMVGTGVEMLCRLFNIANDSEHRLTMGTSALILNAGFSFLTGQGIYSKIMAFQAGAFSNDVEQQPLIESDKVKKLITHQMISEIDFLLTSTSVMAIALATLSGSSPTNNPLKSIVMSMGVIKAVNYILGHANIQYQHISIFESLNQESKQFLAENIESLWYGSNEKHELEYNINYLRAGIATNIVIGIYSAITIIEGCDGAQGPSGEASCTKATEMQNALLIFHTFSMFWLGASLLAPGISNVSLQEWAQNDLKKQKLPSKNIDH